MTCEAERPGPAELAEIISNPAVRLALFAGAEGGEGAGEIAYGAARVAARRYTLADVFTSYSTRLNSNRFLSES